MAEQIHILIIEDDEDIRDGIRILLEGENYIVTEAENGMVGLKRLNDQIDLVILDVMMPGMSGIKVCETIRKESNVPVLFLTAKSQESDKLIGLVAGGDDYLVKPFSYAELLGRVKALTRRYTVYKGKGAEIEERHDDDFIEIGDVKLHTTYNEVYIAGEEKELTEKEYQILKLLIENKGKICSAQLLFEKIWGEPFYYNCSSTIMVHIRKLRMKVEDDPNNPERVCTVWGKGYRFEEKN